MSTITVARTHTAAIAPHDLAALALRNGRSSWRTVDFVSVASRNDMPSCGLQIGQPIVAQKPRRRRHYLDVSKLATTEPPTQDQDINLEDLDDAELDELFAEYGEVVREEETRPVSAEVDDDADSLAFAVAMAEAANEVKGGDIRVLCVKPLVYWTRFFVIATGYSRPQVDAIGGRIRDLAEKRFKRTPRGDVKPNAWTLLDFGDVVVHIFFPKERAFYNLEEFYGNATLVELPFESETREI
ncbi:hypothetical protein R1sor_010640 [Riccia sorocarpa]|uniref:Protein Iojap, chloroplastic n=1 Tax=Riccia sorocarpa TaxID=122646 RepID=A0ABD3I0H4_9MARC